MWEIITGSIINGNLTIGNLLICTVCSLAVGFAAAGIYMFRSQYSKGLAVTLIFIPATVQIIVLFMFTRGNIGLGIAIMGAFSLVRFRSFPGKARDIGTVFFVMAIGIVMGMGYIFYAFIFLLLIGGVSMLMTFSRLGHGEAETRFLRITIPENLDYDGLFDEVFAKYTQSVELVRVRTTNMGSLYELTYSVRLKSPSVPKEFMDELRCRNGNLNIQISREQRGGEEL
jgi:hypothetical protein